MEAYECLGEWMGTRERAWLALSRLYSATRIRESLLDRSSMSQSDEELVDARFSGDSSSSNSLKGLDNLIMEAIHSMRDFVGSSNTTIAEYIEDQYWAPLNFRRILSGKLKHLSAMAKLFKVKCRFSIAPLSKLSTIARRRISPGIHRDDFGFFGEEVTSLELARISSMTPEEAFASAARLLSEAEEAMAEAEEALREAEAEAAQAFAEAVLRTERRKRHS